jgi:hypothetical protein
MWISAILISLPSFLFGYIMAALNSCLVFGSAKSASRCFQGNDDGINSCPIGTMYKDIDMSTSI